MNSFCPLLSKLTDKSKSNSKGSLELEVIFQLSLRNLFDLFVLILQNGGSSAEDPD